VFGEEFMKALRDGDDVTALRRFAPHLKRQLTPGRFAVGRQALSHHFGQIMSWRLVTKETDHEEERREYELQCSRTVVHATLTFHRGTTNIIGVSLFRDSVYVPAPVPGIENAISWTDTTVGPSLGATVASPRDSVGGSRPAVVLIGEGGSLDRDETVGVLRPFRDLGDGLASRGIVTIRFDKRCFSLPQVCRKVFTVDEDLIQDAVSAVAVVRRETGVDPSRIFIVGHGLGGLVAAEVARRAGGVAGLVMMGVPARPLIYVTLEKLREKNVSDEVMTRAAAQVKSVLDKTAPQSAEILGTSAAFWYDLAKRDIVADLRRLARPVLLVRGEADGYAVATDQQRWLEELAGLKVRAETIPLVNHGMVAIVPTSAARSGPPSDGGPRVPEYLLDLIADFVTRSPAAHPRATTKR
jgi:pimeloyl-ACP methyl ester carboxylesterase